MRCSPQVGFSAAKRRINSLTSAVTGGLPTGLDFQRQKRRNALRCQPIKVAGLTISKGLRQSNQRANLENTNLLAGVVGIAFLLPFPEQSQLFAQKQILSCRGRAATP